MLDWAHWNDLTLTTSVQILSQNPVYFWGTRGCVYVSLSVMSDSDFSPAGPSVHGILQARILEWVAMPSSRGSSQPKDQTQVSCTVVIGLQNINF